MSADNLKFLRSLTNEQIHQLIREGKIPDQIRNHRFREILEAGRMIDALLNRMDAMGFSPYDIHYALVEQTYFSRFALEDMGPEQTKTARDIENEIAGRMVEHRKKYPPKVMQANAEETDRALKAARAKRLKDLEATNSTIGGTAAAEEGRA